MTDADFGRRSSARWDSMASRCTEAVIPAEAEHAHRLRDHVDRFLAHHGATGDLRIDVALAVTEATNALLHSRSDEPITLHADIEDDSFDVVVLQPRALVGRDPGMPGSGLSLTLLASLADVFHVEQALGGGLQVYLRFILREP